MDSVGYNVQISPMQLLTKATLSTQPHENVYIANEWP